ncbi:hypothetical protein DFH09DRAFT_1461873 [Mycena vulgaris]|nr:hypothetical protein DFH09DRAFT_1461873 [Mycena vulgaris]
MSSVLRHRSSLVKPYSIQFTQDLIAMLDANKQLDPNDASRTNCGAARACILYHGVTVKCTRRPVELGLDRRQVFLSVASRSPPSFRCNWEANYDSPSQSLMYGSARSQFRREWAALHLPWGIRILRDGLLLCDVGVPIHLFSLPTYVGYLVGLRQDQHSQSANTTGDSAHSTDTCPQVKVVPGSIQPPFHPLSMLEGAPTRLDAATLRWSRLPSRRTDLAVMAALVLLYLGNEAFRSTAFPPRELFFGETNINHVTNRSDVVQPLVGANDTFDIAVTVWCDSWRRWTKGAHAIGCSTRRLIWQSIQSTVSQLGVVLAELHATHPVVKCYNQYFTSKPSTARDTECGLWLSSLRLCPAPELESLMEAPLQELLARDIQGVAPLERRRRVFSVGSALPQLLAVQHELGEEFNLNGDTPRELFEGEIVATSLNGTEALRAMSLATEPINLKLRKGRHMLQFLAIPSAPEAFAPVEPPVAAVPAAGSKAKKMKSGESSANELVAKRGKRNTDGNSEGLGTATMGGKEGVNLQPGRDEKSSSKVHMAIILDARTLVTDVDDVNSVINVGDGINRCRRLPGMARRALWELEDDLGGGGSVLTCSCMVGKRTGIEILHSGINNPYEVDGGRAYLVYSRATRRAHESESVQFHGLACPMARVHTLRCARLKDALGLVDAALSLHWCRKPSRKLMAREGDPTRRVQMLGGAQTVFLSVECKKIHERAAGGLTDEELRYMEGSIVDEAHPKGLDIDEATIVGRCNPPPKRARQHKSL